MLAPSRMLSLQRNETISQFLRKHFFLLFTITKDITVIYAIVLKFV